MKGKLIITMLALCFLTGCSSAATETEIEHTTYTAQGRYYTCGEVVTTDGNVWGYTQDIISEMESYDHQPVFALFDDNGTPDNIYDDEIYGLVLDRETAIYDALEVALSDKFTIERNGNVISVLDQNK